MWWSLSKNYQSKFVEQFPTKSTSAWTYFSRPLVNPGEVKTDIKHMLTLAEVSDLFETYLLCPENYQWTLQKGFHQNIRRLFLKEVQANYYWSCEQEVVGQATHKRRWTNWFNIISNKTSYKYVAKLELTKSNANGSQKEVQTPQ